MIIDVWGRVAILALLLCGGCAASPAKVAEVPPGLNGNKLGRDFLSASSADKLSYCNDSVKAYKTSGVQSFSVSPSIGNLTGERLCGQLAEYFKDEPIRSTERLSQSSATAMLLYARPPSRKQDTELEQMESRKPSK